MQSVENMAVNLVCTHCLPFVGSLRTPLGVLAGDMMRHEAFTSEKTEAPPVIPVMPGLSDLFNDEIFKCEADCGEVSPSCYVACLTAPTQVYCSEVCRSEALRQVCCR